MADKVFCIGVFDTFHAGHLSLLKQAAAFGDLTVGIVEDEAVARVKGASRPIIPMEDRTDIVQALKCVYNVVELTDFYIPELIIEKWDIIVVGADQQHVRGIDKVPIEKLRKIERPQDSRSTTKIISKIKES